MEEEQKSEEARRRLDEMMADAVEAAINMAVGYLAGRKGKSDAWRKRLVTEIIAAVQPREYVMKTSRAVDEVLALERMLKATDEPEARP